MKNRVDLSQVLSRRRFTVEQWLASEQITTVAQLKVWKKDHDAEYVISDEFIRSAKNILKSNELSQAVAVTDQMKDQEVKNAFVELPAEKSERKTKRQDTVNNPQRDD